MTTPETHAGQAVRSTPLLAGDSVTWTHVSQRGRSINMTTREGKIEKRSELKPECFIVKWRGRKIRIHETHLRKRGERTTLTEFVMGREKDKANPKVLRSPLGGDKEQPVVGISNSEEK